VRRLLLLLAPALLVIGCGAERPDEVAESGSRSAATPSPTSTPALPAGPLAAFPLDLGYAEENGDDGSPVLVTDQPGLHRLDYCGRLAWDPRAGTTDLIGVEFRGEAEWARGRTLVRYPTVEAATAVIESARAAVEACHEEPLEDDYDYVAVHTVQDGLRLGDQSLGWTDTGGFRQDDEIQFDTGLTVYHLVRVGRAVLGSYEYGEGNSGPDSPAIDDAIEADLPVVDRMSELSGS